MADSNDRISAPTTTTTTRPTITIPPPRPPPEAFSTAGASPSPMSIVSNFFADNFPDLGADFRGSFSQLLAGTMVSPSSAALLDPSSSLPDNRSAGGFKLNRPADLTVPVPVQAPVSPLFQMSPGFSPSAFFNSPAPAGFFSHALSPFGISHQQALAQVTAQAVLSQSAFPSSSSAMSSMEQVNMSHQPFTFTTLAQDHSISISVTEPSKQRASEPPQDSRVDRRVNVPVPAPVAVPAPVDKPADDGFNWRKYGQKQVKGSEYPRSYYRCTNMSCPVKKKVERSKHGHITEIIYKGQHNHEPPQPARRSRDNNTTDNNSQWSNGALLGRAVVGGDEDSVQATSIQLHGPSDSEDSGDGYQGSEENEEEEEEPNAKRRNTGAGTSGALLLQKTVTEPKIIVQTRSQVDLLDDGFRWRKYGQKVVKGNTNPRSYYKCTTPGCGVRKHVERSSTDQEAVITTYEGKHNHDIPLGRNSGGKAAQQAAAAAALHDRKQAEMDYENKGQIAFLRLKEEQVLV